MKLLKAEYSHKKYLELGRNVKDGETIVETEDAFEIVAKPSPTEAEVLSDLRYLRDVYCFPIINRGVLWYNRLTEEQRLELDVWYKEWLDVTDKYTEGIDIETIIPKKPEWLK